MLKRLRRPTNPAAADGDTVPLNTSWIIGEACPRTPMPAVTFRQRTAQSSANWGVRIAVLTCTCPPATRARGFAGAVQPEGVQPGGGTRKVNAPASIAAK